MRNLNRTMLVYFWDINKKSQHIIKFNSTELFDVNDSVVLLNSEYKIIEVKYVYDANNNMSIHYMVNLVEYDNVSN